MYCYSDVKPITSILNLYLYYYHNYGSNKNELVRGATALTQEYLECLKIKKVLSRKVT